MLGLNVNVRGREHNDASTLAVPTGKLKRSPDAPPKRCGADPNVQNGVQLTLNRGWGLMKPTLGYAVWHSEHLAAGPLLRKLRSCRESEPRREEPKSGS